MRQLTIKQITASGSEEIIPSCDKCQELLTLANTLVYQELHASNLERHLNSQHSHQYVANTDKIMDGGYFSSSSNPELWDRLTDLGENSKLPQNSFFLPKI
jgi:hypothetical protein